MEGGANLDGGANIEIEHLETPESLDMVYTWYILGIYF
jgi:hypothetical protein